LVISACYLWEMDLNIGLNILLVPCVTGNEYEMKQGILMVQNLVYKMILFPVEFSTCRYNISNAIPSSETSVANHVHIFAFLIQ
jgi:hypothetical protein